MQSHSEEIFPGYHPESFESIELHVFVDASEEAYVALPNCEQVSSALYTGFLKDESGPSQFLVLSCRQHYLESD